MYFKVYIKKAYKAARISYLSAFVFFAKAYILCKSKSIVPSMAYLLFVNFFINFKKKLNVMTF